MLRLLLLLLRLLLAVAQAASRLPGACHSPDPHHSTCYPRWPNPAGGKRHGSSGYFVEPTVFADVTDEMTVAREEIFGPVQCILKYHSLEEVCPPSLGCCMEPGAALGCIALRPSPRQQAMQRQPYLRVLVCSQQQALTGHAQPSACQDLDGQRPCHSTAAGG